MERHIAKAPSRSVARRLAITGKSLFPKPTRIVVDRHGSARPPKLGDRYDVIFVRDDGWSLGAPKRFRRTAHKLWAGSWVEVIECPGAVMY